jgi:transposase-like protein
MTKISYGGYRFLPEIIQQAIWLYIRFTLSFREVEDLLAERGIWYCHIEQVDAVFDHGEARLRHWNRVAWLSPGRQ